MIIGGRSREGAGAPRGWTRATAVISFGLSALAIATSAQAQSGPVKEYVYLGDRLLAQQTNFGDVPQGNPYYDYVNILLSNSVTSGCDAVNYCPTQQVTREQMAVFLLRSEEGPQYTPPACGTPMFADVPAASPYCRWIEELARRNVTSGCGGGNYCPTTSTANDAMAVFLLRTRLGSTYVPPPCTTPVFSDVPCSSGYAPWVNDLAARGITTGCGGGLYCPTAAVTRGPMAKLLTLTFDLH